MLKACCADGKLTDGTERLFKLKIRTRKKRLQWGREAKLRESVVFELEGCSPTRDGGKEPDLIYCPRVYQKVTEDGCGGLS